VKKAPLPKKVRLTLIVLAVVFVGLLAVRIYNSRRFHLEKQARFMMDTYVTIYAVGPKKVTSRAIDLALDRMQEVDTKFNILNPKSPLYAFNRQGVPISDQEILDVVRLALEVSHDSGGAFDITISPLIELWGFYGDSPNLPQEQEIRECLNKIGYRHLNIEDGRLERTKEDMGIDLGGIAKGYSVSQAAKVLKAEGATSALIDAGGDVLKAEGATSALIDAGGDVYALGKKGRKFWNVGIRSPRGEDLLGYVEVEDLAVMGSGDYERFFIEDGKRFHHILDPKTGYPAEGLSGITVIYPDPIIADAWATAKKAILLYGELYLK
jgi:thiamine biosynthesis lipoprotein